VQDKNIQFLYATFDDVTIDHAYQNLHRRTRKNVAMKAALDWNQQ
jgi:hypothetical protein